MSAPFDGIYEGKRVLLTGHTGFKGSWLSLWLGVLGAEVTGYALPPHTVPSMFDAADVASGLRHIVADVRDAARLREVVATVRPHAIFHLAAQPLVRPSYENPLETIDTNVMGTANLLEAVRACVGQELPCAVVIITSDKCYENREWVYGYREEDPMGGHDPYSMSKGAAELLVSAWRRSFFPVHRIGEHGCRLATARAGNVIGGGDWGVDRIMTDCIAALRRRVPIPVRNPHATRPWQHVLEPLAAYLLLCARLLDPDPSNAARFATAWNFGPPPESVWTVRRLVEEVVHAWGSGNWKDASEGNAPHEASLLALCCDKAFHHLGWKPVWPLEKATEITVRWFRELDAGGDMRTFSVGQIRDYTEDSRQAGSVWLRPAVGRGVS